jgi:thiol-disulfide isomerase/thioredoxin
MDGMMTLKHACIIVAIFVLVPSFQIMSAYAESIKIEKLDKAGLEALLKKKDCRCMVVAMAAWCSPCRKELPILVDLYSRYQSQGLEIVGISLDLDGPQAIQPIIDKAKVNFPVYWVGEAAIEDFNIYAIPMVFIVKEGKVVERIPGARKEKDLENKIRDLLAD